MTIAVLGMSVIGIIHSLVFSSLENEIIAYDDNQIKIDSLKRGIPLCKEPGVKEMLSQYNDNILFTCNIEEALKEAEIIVITSETIEVADGSIDLSEISQYIQNIIKYAAKDAIIIIKTSVPIGTAKQVEEMILNHKRSNPIVINPDFYSLETLVDDLKEPKQIVAGVKEVETHVKINWLYRSFIERDISICFTSPTTAEVIKHAADRFAGVKNSFINEVAAFCDRVGADIVAVVSALSANKNIGNSYLEVGAGYGTHINNKKRAPLSFPELREPLDICRAAEISNRKMPRLFAQRIINRFSSNEKKPVVAVLGLSNVKERNGINNSPAAILIDTLLKNEIEVVGYDYNYESEFAISFGKNKLLRYSDELKDAIKHADCVVIMSDSADIKQLNQKIFLELMGENAVVFDAINLFNPMQMSKIEYHPFGRAIIHKYIEKGPFKD